ncbi:MAG TPA: thiosulfate oxidation carrier protein SoxY [Burkholderiales bacterium]|nr:thiosulfate oxidation carrier protein SoxY [Burkholderiales bacterium]
MARLTEHGMRRRSLAALVAALALPRRALAQPVVNPVPGIDARTINTPQGALQSILKGAEMRRGRVLLELPTVADNGHSVPMTVRVDSPMSNADHVRRIDLVSEKNPVPLMATFFLGPHMGRAEIESRVRLNGTQRVTAVAQLSDGSFWFDAADIAVNESACLDGG